MNNKPELNNGYINRIGNAYTRTSLTNTLTAKD